MKSYKHHLWPQCYETRNQSQEETEKHAKTWKLNNVTKQWMGQQWDQGRNQKIPWNKWKWGHNNPKSVEHWESNPKRKIHSITGLSGKKKEREREKAQINNLTSHLKELEK